MNPRLPQLVGNRFQVLFTPLTGVLFTFPLRYWFAIGRWIVLSLGRWSSRIPTRFHVPRGTQVPARLLSVSDTGLSPALAKLSSLLLLPNHRSFMPALQPPALTLYTEPNSSMHKLSAGFGLCPVRSPLLGASRLISFPAGTEMFHFPALAPVSLFIQLTVTGHDSRRVSPFRHLRLKGCLAPPRSFSQPTTSFIAFQRQGIHLVPLVTYSSNSHIFKHLRV